MPWGMTVILVGLQPGRRVGWLAGPGGVDAPETSRDLTNILWLASDLARHWARSTPIT